MDELICFGSEVKALGSGKVGGYLVRFGSPSEADLAGEFFTAKTDFGTDLPGTTAVYYNHGLDPKLGKRRLGAGEMKMDEYGVWIEAQLDCRDRYEQMVYKLAEAGKLGWSSGTAPHLVEREPAGKAAWLKHWPLGLDASLTPNPCEPRDTHVIPLKTWQPESLDALAATDPALKATLDTAESGGTQYDRQPKRDTLTGTCPECGAQVVLSRAAKSADPPEGGEAEFLTAAPGDGAAFFDAKSVLVPGTDFAERAERVVSVCEAFVEQATERSEARVKSGRKLSAASRASIAEAASALNALLAETAPPESTGDALASAVLEAEISLAELSLLPALT